MSRRRPTGLFALTGFAVGLLVALSGGPREAAAQPKAPGIAAAPQSPTINTPASLGARAGEEVELTFTGTNLTGPTAVLFSCPAQTTIPDDNKNGTDAGKLRVKVTVDPKCPIGLYTARVATKNGVSNARPFVVDSLPVAASNAANRTKDTAQAVPAPGVVAGTIAAETSEFFKVKVGADQRLTFEVLARRIGSPLDPIVVLHDAKTKRELIDLYADDTPGLQGDCRLTHTFKEAGEVLVEVRDTTHRGGGDFAYRLRVGEFPGATTAFPLAAARGKAASIGFAGPDAVPPVEVTAPADPGLAAFYVAPGAGWPVPVRLTDYPQLTEQEPNDEPAKANKLPVPGGVSGRFDRAKDVDHFSIAGKKGQKLVVSVQTFEVNSPAEVLVRVSDAKGVQVAASNPAAPVNRFEFVPAADGEYAIACEHQNFLHGPNEVYLLTVAPAGPDLTVALAFDRADAPAGGGTTVFATVNRLNGFAGPVELSVDGDPALDGKVTLPAGQTVAAVPVRVKDGTKPGARPFRVKAVATAGDVTLTRYGTQLDAVRANFGGMTNPPPELLNPCALGVTADPPFALELTAEPAAVEKGKGGKIVVETARESAGGTASEAHERAHRPVKGPREAVGYGDIVIAPLFNPPTVVPAVKPLAKGQPRGEITLSVQPGAPVGPAALVFRVTTKIGGKDYAFIPPPVTIEVIEPKKVEPKKEEPKKDEKKKE
jgi:hypothetical protein